MRVDDGVVAASSDPLAFLSFCLDRRGGRLTRAGKPIPVRRKTWEVLVHLVERPGVLVSKTELLDAVWPDIAVTPDVLIRSIRELRLALGDDSRMPRCIETVHRRGYRFIAEIHASSSGPVRSRFTEDTPTTGQQQPETAIFVGRGAEQQRLEALFAKASAGHRQIVFVTGPAGVGKTTLVEAFLDSRAVRKAASLVWVGRGCCIEQQGAREAYMPVLDALDRLAHRPDAERLARLLRRVAPTWLLQMPWLLGDDAKEMRQSLQTAKPERMLREFAALVEALSTDLTVVLVLEDLHWSDAATADLLAVLAQRGEPARLLVIGTYRPAEAAVQHHTLSQVVRGLQVRRQCVDVPVHELNPEEVRHYLEARFPDADFVPALAPLLHDYTDGNPLFVIAVVEHLLSRGWILETAPGWALSTPVEKLQLEVPDDIRRMIDVQFDGLSPADRGLLQAASVVGTEFAVQSVAAALAASVENTEMRCEVLARRGLLRIAGNTEWPDGNVARRYAFTHELYRQAAYAEIPEGQRQRLHQRIGEALEVAYGERVTVVAPELAVHFEHSRDHTRALRYCAAAAARARQRFANREAVGYFATALALAARLPDEGKRWRQELELRIALGPALSDLHGFASDPVRGNCERAYELCAQVGTTDQLFQVLYGLCHVYAVQADKAVLPALEKLDDLAQRLATAESRLLADTILMRVAMETGRFIEACRLAEKRRLSPASRKTGHPSFAYGADPLIAAYCHYAMALWMLGYTERAGTTMEASLAAARESRSPFTQTGALGQSCILELFRRNSAAVGELAERLVSTSAEHGFPFWNAMGLALRGWAWVQKGQTREGVADLERALTAHRASGARLFSTHMLAFLAEAHLRAGDIDAGLAAIDEALAVAQSSLDHSYWPELWRLKGELLLAVAAHRRPASGSRKSPVVPSDPAWPQAEQCLLRAVEMAHESEAKSLELRAATSLARAWHGRRRSVEARAVLGDICQWFGTTADSPDLADARTVLAALTSTKYARRGTRAQLPRTRRRARPLSRTR
jgi:predicted ATPase